MCLKRLVCGAVFTNKMAALFGIVSLAAIPLSFAADNNDEEQQWTATWSAGEAGISGARQYANQTLRLIVHTSIGGQQVRVRISNAFGTKSLVIGAAHVALRKSGPRITPGTDRALSFSGQYWKGLVGTQATRAARAEVGELKPLRYQG
jgi:hypothetical protein